MLNEKQADFLRRLEQGLHLSLANREEDRARQFCRKNGYAKVIMNPRRWIITNDGLRVLKDYYYTLKGETK